MDDFDEGELGIDPDLMEQMLEERAAMSSRKRPSHHLAPYISAPRSFVSDVCLLTEGRAALVVALCIYRRTRICESRTVTLPTSELAELDVDRRRKHEALTRLQNAGLIKVEKLAGQTARITLTWRRN